MAITSITNSIYVDGKTSVRVSWAKSTLATAYEVVWGVTGYSYSLRTTGTSAAYTIPTSWLNALSASEKSITGTVQVKEYRGSTTPYDTWTENFTAIIPASAGRPILASGWATLGVYNTGTPAAGFSTYIQGYSRVKATIDETKITTRYGATIADIRMMAQGKALPSPYISDALKESGTIAIDCYVTDSRGFTTRETVGSITVLPYSAPTLSNVVLLRSLNNGAPSDSENGDIDGGYLYARATSVTASSVGMQSLVLMYKLRGTSTYTSTSLTSGTGKAVSISALRAYDAVIMVTDGVGNTNSVGAIIPHASKTFRVKDGGKAVGIGAAPGADETVTLGWKLILEEGLESYVPLTPVGGCVMLASDMDPETAFGGSWEQVTWSSAPDGVLLWKRTA